MAMDTFGSVFGEAKPPVAMRMRPILFHAHAHTNDVSQLRLLATDLHSLAWDRSLSLSDIDDLVSPFSSQALISISISLHIVLFPERRRRDRRLLLRLPGLPPILPLLWGSQPPLPSQWSVPDLPTLRFFTLHLPYAHMDNTTGLDRVHLVATKAKGLPRITISLNTLTHSALNDVIANFSLSLYAAFRTTQDHASRGPTRFIIIHSLVLLPLCFCFS